MTQSQKILIAGAGIAGLTAALCLAQKGFKVEIHEQAETFSVVGAGLQLSPNALRILHEIGLDNRIQSVANTPSGIILRDAKNAKQLARVPLGKTAVDRYGLPYLVVHRADLIGVLANACREHRDIDIRLGSRMMVATEDSNGIAVQTTQGQTGGQFLVAADGVWSKFRSDYLKLQSATYSGQTAWRCLIPAEDVPPEFMDETNLWLSSKGHGVTYAVKDKRYLNMVVALGERDFEQNWSKQSDRLKLLVKISNWSDRFKDLIPANADLTSWPLFTASNTPKWHGKNVVLIGDAAHAMLPYAAQGAAQAIEDAHVLALKLSQIDDHNKAFNAYQKARKPRINRVQKLVAANRSVYHMGALPALARNLVMKTKSPESLLARQDWLYGWKAE